MAHFSAEDQRRVGAAIKAAEATTAGEIVCVLARASSDYMSLCDRLVGAHRPDACRGFCSP